MSDTIYSFYHIRRYVVSGCCIKIVMLRLSSKFTQCQSDPFKAHFISFILAAVTNHHKLDGLRQQKFILLHSGGQKPKLKMLAFPLVTLRILSCPFYLVVASGIPWLSVFNLCLCGHIASSSSCACVFSTVSHKDTCHWIYPTWLIQDNLISKPLTVFKE